MLHKLTNLSRLRLLTRRNMNNGLAGLKALAALRKLVVPAGEITDAGVKELGRGRGRGRERGGEQALPATRVFAFWR